MFFGSCALKNLVMPHFSNKVAGLQFLLKIDSNIGAVKFAKSLRASFLQDTSGGYFWKYLMNSLFIAYGNDESCHCGGTYWLSSAYFILLRVFRSFLFLSFFFFFLFILLLA